MLWDTVLKALLKQALNIHRSSPVQSANPVIVEGNKVGWAGFTLYKVFLTASNHPFVFHVVGDSLWEHSRVS